MAKLTKNLAPLFDSSISYEPGERFMYGDHMYEALEPLSGAFDSTKVSEVTLADIFKGVSSNVVKCLAPEYDVNTEYSVENLVLHDGVLYECVETTTGPFDETKWSRKYLSDVGELNSNLINPTTLLDTQTFSNNNKTNTYTYDISKDEIVDIIAISGAFFGGNTSYGAINTSYSGEQVSMGKSEVITEDNSSRIYTETFRAKSAGTLTVNLTSGQNYPRATLVILKR